MTKKDTANALFRAVCLLFTALLLVYSLLSAIDLVAVNDRAAALEREIAALEEENARLRARYESELSLEELERIAIEELGLQPLQPEQILVLRLDDQG